MKLVRGAWKLLVGIKDALVLVAMLLFFGLLFAALNARSRPAAIKDGALVLELNGPIVEQPEDVAPLAMLSGQQIGNQYRLRDVLRAIDLAREDKRVKAIVLDLDRFGGAYPAALGEVQEALMMARAAGKPVLAYATAYTDGGYRLASAASEIWMDPMGGTLFMGPGGSQLFYKGLLDKLGVNAHVYRVGKFKSAVEPYTRADQSPESREASQALYGALLDQWHESIARARPKAQVAGLLTRPAQLVQAAGGNLAQVDMQAGLVDHLGDRIAFGHTFGDGLVVARMPCRDDNGAIHQTNTVKGETPGISGKPMLAFQLRQPLFLRQIDVLHTMTNDAGSLSGEVERRLWSHADDGRGAGCHPSLPAAAKGFDRIGIACHLLEHRRDAEPHAHN